MTSRNPGPPQGGPSLWLEDTEGVFTALNERGLPGIPKLQQRPFLDRLRPLNGHSSLSTETLLSRLATDDHRRGFIQSPITPYSTPLVTLARILRQRASFHLHHSPLGCRDGRPAEVSAPGTMLNPTRRETAVPAAPRFDEPHRPSSSPPDEPRDEPHSAPRSAWLKAAGRTATLGRRAPHSSKTLDRRTIT